MSTILARRHAALTPRQELHKQAVDVGIDPVVASTTRTSDLRALIAAAPQLQLVADLDYLDELDAPRLGKPLTPLQRLESSGMTPDEIASVLTFARRATVDPEWVSADGFTPNDFYTGPGAA